VGTGFAVNRRGDVVTNHHVVDGCTQIAVFGSAGQQKVEIIAEDGQNDLAVVGPIKQAGPRSPWVGTARSSVKAR